MQVTYDDVQAAFPGIPADEVVRGTKVLRDRVNSKPQDGDILAAHAAIEAANTLLLLEMMAASVLAHLVTNGKLKLANATVELTPRDLDAAYASFRVAAGTEGVITRVALYDLDGADPIRLAVQDEDGSDALPQVEN